MFANTPFNQNINSWNVSSVTNMSHMFSNIAVQEGFSNSQKKSLSADASLPHMLPDVYLVNSCGLARYNQPLNNWNTSNVRDMSYMFAGSLFNQPIGNWNTSNVINMKHMFELVPFSQSLNNWNTSNVRDMSYMFNQKSRLNSDSSDFVYFPEKKTDYFPTSLNSWDTRKVTTMRAMFEGSAFNQDISSWDTSNVTDMSHMFASSMFDYDISRWNVENVKNFRAMFSLASFNQNINNWNVRNGQDFAFMFGSNRNFNNPLDKWNMSNAISLQCMFCAASRFNQNINNWDISKVTNLKEVFESSYVFNHPLNNWKVDKVIDMNGMFKNARNFNQPLNNWDISKVEDINNMFDSARSFDQDLSDWNPKSLKTGVNFIRSTKFSVDNNDKLLISWSKKVPNTSNKVPIGIDVPACEAAGILKNLDSNYDFEVLKSDNECKVLKYVLFKDKDRGLQISFEVNTPSRTRKKRIIVNGKSETILEKYGIAPGVDSRYLYEKDKKKPEGVDDIGLTYIGEFVDDTKETMRFTIE